MSLLNRTVTPGNIKKLTERLPFVGARVGLNNSFSSQMSSSIEQQLGATSSTGWLFSTVDRISEGVAMQDWDCYQDSSEGLPVKINDHPLAKLWQDINPFWTRHELIKVSEAHYRLVGETWWVLIRDEKTNAVIEIWPVRPDRMSHVKDDKKYCTGYIYRRGREWVPLELEDVVFMKNPDPLDDYRGKGAVQSILADIESEKFAALWARNFFLNSAQPSGIIQFPDRLNDEEFASIMMRWRETHQGVSNAHRVAIIEGGEWKDSKYTQRDMQFIDTRKVNRDTILGAFGVPMPILGITEAVNRANAEAGEYIFAKLIVKPSLERYKEHLNYDIAPSFGDNTYLTFKDPVPPDPTVNLNSAVQGYQVGLISQNEGRRRLGENPSADGDKDVFGLPIHVIVPEEIHINDSEKDMINFHVKKISKSIDVDSNYTAIWHRRLLDEANNMIKHVNRIYNVPTEDKIFEVIADKFINELIVREKSNDFNSYNWDWETKYGNQVQLELEEVFIAVFNESIDNNLPSPSALVIRSLAKNYANHRMIEILASAGPISIVSTTRDLMNKLSEQNLSIIELKESVINNYAFSANRARMISNTEIAFIRGIAKYKCGQLQGHDEKHWICLESVDQECLANEAMGWIPMGEKFANGVYCTPGRPNCQCFIETRLHGNEHTVIIEGKGLKVDGQPTNADEPRCPQCNHRLNVRGITGEAKVFCSYCKKEFLMSG